MSAQDTTTTARALYGDGWHDLPRFVQDAAADFVADLLDLDALDISETLRGCGSDRVHECADAAVPVYDWQRYALVADPRTCDAIEEALDEFGADAMRDADGRVSLSTLIGVGVYGAISNALSVLLAAVETADGFEALGLDADAAEVAVALLPEWSGTIRELVEAAPRLASEGVAR
jgi:hypothetical protein